MLSKTTLICWILTVFAGSLVFSLVDFLGNDFHWDLGDVWEMGLLSMAVSAMLGSPALLVLLFVINVYRNRDQPLSARLRVLHLVHAAVAVLTFTLMYLWQPDDDVLVIAACYIPTAALIWLIAVGVLKRRKAAESASQVAFTS